MPKITARMIVNLMLACLLVGPVLSNLNFDPRDILEGGQDAIEWLIEVGREVFGWSITYILIGAIVAIPIWLELSIMKSARDHE